MTDESDLLAAFPALSKREVEPPDMTEGEKDHRFTPPLPTG